MLELLNRYAHGLVSIPLLHALGDKGCLASMEARGTFSAGELAGEFDANAAYLRVALRAMGSLGWVRASADGRFEATAELRHRQVIPAGIMELYRFPFDAFVEGKAGEPLEPWLSLSERRWNTDHPYLADYLDGVLVLPLLLALATKGRLQVVERAHGAEVVAQLRVGAAAGPRAAIERLFLARGWAVRPKRALHLSRAGRFVVDRLLITATVASYRPMLANAEELLFGDASRAFVLDAEGHETHVDRTLNVVGSGFQHEKYFAALSEAVVRLFDHGDYGSQPKYVVDVGCGDGSLLLRLYEAVRDRTARGQALGEHPLVLVAVDYNEKALAEAARTLEGIPHLTVRGDIGDPRDLVERLRANGIEDLDEVLQVRSFLDHNRPYHAPLDRAAADRRPRTGGGIYIGADGEAIPPADLVQSTVEHLERWSHVVARHGLVVLEVHSLPAGLTADYLDESESFHFDAYHALSHQYLLEADTFLLCAAEAGLFCRGDEPRRYPRHLPFTRISLNHFEKRPYVIRHAAADDLPALLELHEVTPGAAGDEAEQLVLVADGRVMAAARCVCEGDAVRVFGTRASAARGHVHDLLRFVGQYGLSKGGIQRITGLEEELAAADAFAPESMARAVAEEVACRAPGYPFAPENDPREGERELGIFSLRWVLANLQRLGVMREAGEVFGSEELKGRLGIVPKYHRYFDVLLGKLEREGLLESTGGRFRTTPRVRDYGLGDIEAEVAEFGESFRSRYPACAALQKLTASCLTHYGDILTGKATAADVLFAGEAADVFADVFRGDAVSDYFNRIVSDAVRAAVVRSREAGQDTVRILEIGAGTGGSTVGILEALAPMAQGVEFCFTDISPAFMRRAKREFGEQYPWVEYRVLDIEADLSRQGFEPQAFDVVVANNVLHDTRYIDDTLRQTGTLLRPGGLLVLNEYTALKECLSFSGALLHGWWLFQDPERRLPDSCLLSVPLWRGVFERTGFALLGAHALPTQGLDESCSQSVMLCEAPSVAAPAGTRAPAAQAAAAEVEDRAAAPQRDVPADPGEIVGAAVEEAVLTLLGEGRASAYSPRRPVMEMGLDSIELVELKMLLAQRFGVDLTPMFLFEHETPEKAAAALRRMVPEAQLRPAASEAPAAVEAAEPEAQPDPDAIAIVGIACRFPGGATSPARFWELLERGEPAIGRLPAGRWEWPGYVDVDGSHRGIDRGGFLERIDEFDAPFFRTSAREAELMDPQQRLLLELSWEAMEDAAQRPAELSGRKVGVFVGACHGDYREVVAGSGAPAGAYASSGTAFSMLSNRVSYFYDLKGPSLTVDTACSSSLCALHEAVMAIRRGDCEQALVGAANLQCSPTNSISYYHAGMLSPSGVCRTFDHAADGYVRGEGGAMLLVKPLAAALADGNSVYGLVRGSAVGHGGQAATLTAPKPEAQAAVIEAAWTAAGVAADTAAYIESHGTGTRLGDPVEVSGLIQAFRRLYEAQGASWPATPSCALGAVKANMGHLEAAAGLAGVIKLLLAFQHGTRPGLVNFERVNPDIHLAGTPFYIPTRSEAWTPARDERGAPVPRRAGVSSFGFGGANAHVVVEEYPQPAPAPAAAAPQVVPLSARDGERLVQLAGSILEVVEDVSLRELAYTLQVGREPMDARAAFVVGSREELRTGLERYIAGEASSAPAAPLAAGSVRPAEEKRAVAAAIARHDLAALAALWTGGAEVDWNGLYTAGTPRRIHLPTYPFARERYWVPASPQPVRASAAPLHPMVHKDTSDAAQRRFSSTFTGGEFFLSDHRIGGRSWMPAVAYLEMAREAVARATRSADGGATVVGMRDIVWLRPLVVEDAAVDVHVRLSQGSAAEVAFDIYGVAGGSEAVYARGRALLGVPEAQPRVDAGALDGRGAESVIPGDACYAAYDALGIEFGPAHRALEAVHAGREELMARIALPASLAGTRDQFVLHPALLDAALQSLVAFTWSGGPASDASRPWLPFLLQAVDIHGPCAPSMRAVVRRVDTGAGPGRTARYNIDLCDTDGRVCVRLTGLFTRPQPLAAGTAPAVHAVSAAPSASIHAAVSAAHPASPTGEGAWLRRQVGAAVARMVTGLLVSPPAHLDSNLEFTALGFDSLSYAELAEQLQSSYGLDLTPTVLFAYPTVERLTAFLVETHGEALSPHFPAAPAAAARADEPSAEPPRPVRMPALSAAAAPAPAADDRIAIVGMSGRFPMARNVDELWENLLAGRDCIGEIPPERWDWRTTYPDHRWGGFIDGIDEFDPSFFGVTRREAELMDPQQRLLLMHVWKAIEDAGYAPSSLSGSNTGVFVGTGLSDYGRLATEADIRIDAHTATSTVPSVGPNRVSYFLNLHGPSEPIETTCSSSLVAVHRGVWAIRSGQCDMAMVGGVNTIVTPDLHIGCNRAGMLSADGRCKTFSARADGYVRSEGIGILFLKKLSAAEADGDRIYGVILASAENHGGRSSSLTAPNPQAQADLLRRAYTQAGIDPASVSYIEAHGTGTPLGDPIEVDALKAAFGDLYAGRGGEPATAHCGLGSVKSNIGHLELAAGVAGVIKVLSQMKHRTLVPTLHADTVNPHVRLDGSPFYLVREAAEWKPRDARGTELPRRAGVSSFGFGGVNAHVVLEEYAAPARTRGAVAPVAVVLSARDPERLREQAAELLAFLAARRVDDGDLADIAYTLQVGRDAMDERLGMAVSSAGELQQKLADFAAGRDAAGVYRGQSGKSGGILAMLADDDELRGVVDRWVRQRRYDKLLELWVSGMEVDWERLYDGELPRRVGLPTYSFARERCWVRKSARIAEEPAPRPREAEPTPHRYTTALTGDEPFLSDHVVQGRKLLPAVVYLEMARAALERAGGEYGRAISFRDVTWMRPFYAGAHPARLSVQLTPGAGELSFQISSEGDGNGTAPMVHAQGAARQSAAQPRTIDLAAVRARCPGPRYSGQHCYDAFAAMGYHYGPAQRGIDEIHVGTDELVARLVLPAGAMQAGEGYVLHPGLADSAVQAMIGFALADRRGAGDDLPRVVPFELREAEIFGPCSPVMWAVVRRSGQGSFDIDLCDEAGLTRARFAGLATRTFQVGSPVAPPAEAAPSAGELALVPRWVPAPVDQAPSRTPPAFGTAIIGGTDAQRAAVQRLRPGAAPLPLEPADSIESMARKIDSWGGISHVVWIVPVDAHGASDDSLIAAQREGTVFGFRVIKALLAAGYGSGPLAWSVVTTGTHAVDEGESAWPAHAGVHGLIGSMAREYAGWDVRVFDMPPAGDWPWNDILGLAAGSPGDTLAYRAGRWHRQQLVPARPAADAAPVGRDGDVYVIVGGAGGIGAAVSEALLRRARVQLVWIGRRPADPEIQGRLDALAALGPAPIYIAADVTDREQLAAVRATVLRRFGRIDGLIQAAMVLQDRSLENMTEDELTSVLAPKVDGCVRLAQVFGEDPPGFVIFFSSFNAFYKNPGQSNYVAGSTFQDAFARWLMAEWPSRVRVINWGYWGDVGAVVSERYRSLMARKGFGSIELPGAMRAIDQLLAGSAGQMAYLRVTGRAALQGVAIDFDEPAAVAPVREAAPEAAPAAREAIAVAVVGIHDVVGQPREVAAATLLAHLRQRVAEELGVSPDVLDSPERPFADSLLGEFGLDSLSSNNLRDVLGRDLGVTIATQHILGDPANRIVDALYDQLLIQKITAAPAPALAGEQELETFEF